MSKAEPEPGSSFQQAVRTRVFWTIASGFMCIAVAVSALVVHLVPYLVDRGLRGSQAASVVSLMGVGVLAGRLLAGCLIDRFFAPRVALLLFSVTAAGCLLLLLEGTELASLTAFLIGLSLGAEVDMISFLTSRYFGMTRYGFVYAVTYSMCAIAASLCRRWPEWRVTPQATTGPCFVASWRCWPGRHHMPSGIPLVLI